MNNKSTKQSDRFSYGVFLMINARKVAEKSVEFEVDNDTIQNARKYIKWELISGHIC